MAQRRKSPVTSVTTEPHACSIDLRLKILGRLPFFADLSLKELQAVNQQFVEVGYQPGETIYTSGQPAERLFVVADGKVKLLQQAAAGQNVLLDLLGSGEFFGNLAVLQAGEYTDTARAQTSACVLSMSSAEFSRLLSGQPSLALKTLAVMSERLAAAHQRVLQLSAMPVEQRIAQTLLRLAEKLGRPDPAGLLIDVPLTREELGEMTGATTETVSRVISQLQSSGILTAGRGWLAVNDLARRQVLAGEE
jgi:CRP/FNR family transcriptional regulator, nitrogen oxide reductase regulator